HTAVWTGSEMIVWGGEGGVTGFVILNDGGRYDPSTDTWAAVATIGAPQERAQHVSVWTGTEMIVWGGFASTVLPRAGGRYDPLTDPWRPTTTTGMPEPRDKATAVWTGSEMIVWGGGPFYFDTGGRYDPSRDAWTRTSLKGRVPQGRESHAAVWTG